jgi:spermidine/putrescine transport system ATP-binding protein
MCCCWTSRSVPWTCKLRRQMQIELKRIQTEVGTTFVHVTHDQEEAMTMADTVAVMNAGRIEQLGHPADIYELPRTAFVANFLGQSNLIAGTKVADGEVVEVSAHGAVFRLPGAPQCRNWLRGHRRRSAGENHRRGCRRCCQGARWAQPGDRPGDRCLLSGVSTQYLVRSTWGAELIVFEQNTHRGRSLRCRRRGHPALGPGAHLRPGWHRGCRCRGIEGAVLELEAAR